MKIGDSQPFPIFEETIYLTNYTAGQLLTETSPLEYGFVAKVTDLNSVWTSAGGSLYYAKKTKSGKVLRITGDRTDTDNGTFDTIINPGETIQVRLGATTGAGVVDLVWHGNKTVTRIISKESEFVPSEDLENEGL